jgi:hypothetical protein
VWCGFAFLLAGVNELSFTSTFAENGQKVPQIRGFCFALQFKSAPGTRPAVKFTPHLTESLGWRHRCSYEREGDSRGEARERSLEGKILAAGDSNPDLSYFSATDNSIAKKEENFSKLN